VWGADPAPGEGEPARLDGSRLVGEKTFCSGAGGLHRALVLARSGDGPPSLVYVDLEDAEVDDDWFRAGGMRASVSHRVRFDTEVLAVLGEPGELGREPWFSRDAMRTAAAWAGIADAAADAALADLSARGADDDLRALAAGRIQVARATIDRWMEHGAAQADADPATGLRDLSVQLREAISIAGRTILDEAARACGSRPFATGTPLDRARRDFELFVSSTASIRWWRASAGRSWDEAASDRRLLRRALRGRRRPLELRDQPYEHAKYDATIAALDGRPTRRASRSAARSASSPSGCGHTSPSFSPSTSSEPALAAARRRVPACASSDWSCPRSSRRRDFELIVASEVLYYLDPPAFEAMLERLRGTVLAVHWRHPTRTYPMTGDEVHDALIRRLGPPAYSAPDCRLPPGPMGLVIVGGGPAGLAAARGYRDAGGEGAVVMVTAEHDPPYLRPALSKEFLRGEAEDIALEASDLDVDVRLGAEATALDPVARTVTAGGETLGYDACVLAMGAEPARLRVPGAERAMTLRSLESARELRGRAADCTAATVDRIRLHRLRGRPPRWRCAG
jgi:hypothetical protein